MSPPPLVTSHTGNKGKEPGGCKRGERLWTDTYFKTQMYTNGKECVFCQVNRLLEWNPQWEIHWPDFEPREVLVCLQKPLTSFLPVSWQSKKWKITGWYLVSQTRATLRGYNGASALLFSKQVVMERKQWWVSNMWSCGLKGKIDSLGCNWVEKWLACGDCL